MYKAVRIDKNIMFENHKKSRNETDAFGGPWQAQT